MIRSLHFRSNEIHVLSSQSYSLAAQVPEKLSKKCVKSFNKVIDHLPPVPLSRKAVYNISNAESIADASAKYRICKILFSDVTESAIEPQKF